MLSRLASRIFPTNSPTPPTLSALTKAWLTDAKSRLKPRTCEEAERLIALHVLPELGHINADKITRREVGALLANLSATPGIARNVHAQLRAIYRWGLATGRVDTDPTHGLKTRPAGSRDRVPSCEELATIWHAVAGMSDYCRIVRLLILTGCRRDEIGGALWTELDVPNCQLVIPGSRMKGKRQHIVHLSPLAMSLLPDKRDGFPHIFGRVYGRGFDGWSKCSTDLKRKLDGKVEGWVLHDFRRSLATLGSEMGFGLPHVFDAALAHVQPGVQGRYQRASYLPERRAALELWSEHVEKLVGALPTSADSP